MTVLRRWISLLTELGKSAKVRYSYTLQVSRSNLQNSNTDHPKRGDKTENRYSRDSENVQSS